MDPQVPTIKIKVTYQDLCKLKEAVQEKSAKYDGSPAFQTRINYLKLERKLWRVQESWKEELDKENPFLNAKL